jgi:retron-type reverse transcriptase
MKRDAAPGVDGMTWETYERDLDRRIETLHERVQAGTYRALPSRRSYIPKEDGSKRPLAVAALEDKIVQRAVAAVLSAIHEEDFLGFSYGFRPNRSQHDALDAMIVGIIRLVQKWLRSGILEDGIVTIEEKGTGQGSVISPLLSNIYLHYVFDLWAERWRRREATGDMIMVRYADDTVVGFQHESDARRFRDAMRDRLREFSLSLHPVKTRLIEFGRFAAQNCKRRGRSKPETFKFLGFVLISSPDEAISGSGGSHVATACARSSARSRRGCGIECTGQFLKPGNGSRKSSPAISLTTPCRPTARR